MPTSARNLYDDHASMRKPLYTICIFLLVSAGAVRAAEPIRLVVIPYDTSWGTRRLPVAPFPQLLSPPPPEITPTAANQRSVPPPSKNGAEAAAELIITSVFHGESNDQSWYLIWVTLDQS